MDRVGAVQVVTALLLVAVALAPLGMSITGEGGVVPGGGVVPSGAADPASVTYESAYEQWAAENDRRGRPSVGRSAVDPDAVDPVEGEVRVVAELGGRGELPSAIRREYGESFTREGARQFSGEIPLSAVREVSEQPGVKAVRIDGTTDIEAGSDPVSPGVATVGAAELQDRGATGEGVVVGVIDSGFRLDHPAVAEHVGAYRVFSGDANPAHGTAVASVVADTAPGADLHLAAIGPSTSAAEYRSAVEWLRASGAEVIVDAGSYFGQPGDGSGAVARVAAEAADDVAFVTSAGNYARRHWRDVHRPENDSGYVDVAAGVEGNYLADGDPVAGRVTVGAAWNGSADYDLYLVEDGRSGDSIVASAEADGSHAHLEATVPRARYYVAVYPDDRAARARPHRIDLFASHELRHSTPEGSLTVPAVAEGVTAVGAVADGDPEPFSSRGPTVDGRRGVDLVAPDVVRVDGVETGGGTSFAAPYVAGSVALLRDAYPSLSVERAESIVVESARDVAPPGIDPVTGRGVLDVRAAAAAAALRSVPGALNGTDAAPGGTGRPVAGDGRSSGEGRYRGGRR